LVGHYLPTQPVFVQVNEHVSSVDLTIRIERRSSQSVDVEGEYLLISKFSRRNCKRKIKGLYANATPDLIGNQIRRQQGIPILGADSVSDYWSLA
jgi:hypothetical protein